MWVITKHLLHVTIHFSGNVLCHNITQTLQRNAYNTHRKPRMVNTATSGSYRCPTKHFGSSSMHVLWNTRSSRLENSLLVWLTTVRSLPLHFKAHPTQQSSPLLFLLLSSAFTSLIVVDKGENVQENSSHSHASRICKERERTTDNHIWLCSGFGLLITAKQEQQQIIYWYCCSYLTSTP